MTTATIQEQYIDTPAAAQHLGGLAVPTLNTWRTLGKGPKFVRVGRLIRYRVSDLDAWLESRTVNSTVQGAE
jgi:predicted DNA-binding transcriptional regulator AlpA